MSGEFEISSDRRGWAIVPRAMLSADDVKRLKATPWGDDHWLIQYPPPASPKPRLKRERGPQ